MSAATERAKLRAFYFLYYSSVGVLIPYFAAYLRGLGFRGGEIGSVQMLAPLLAIPFGLGWAALADRRGAAARLLRLSASAALLGWAFLPWARTPFQIGAVVAVAQGILAPATVALVDA